MKRTAITLVLCLFIQMATAQKITHTFSNTPMSKALEMLDRMQHGYSITFLYNELEDFTVTTSVKKLPLPDAIRQIIGFYPIRMTVEGSDIFVECVQKEKTKVQGRVVDQSGHALPFANITLLNVADSAFVNGGVSNEAGMFVVPCEPPRVIVKVSYVGYNTVYRRAGTGHIGTIRMVESKTTVGNVVVKGHRPQYQMGHEGLTTNVAGTPLSHAGTAMDVLAQLPNVSTREGKLTVLGRGTPLIYLNGRKLNDQQELQHLRSEAVRDIEIINNPSARYNAEVTSVIKIRTARQQDEGWGGSLWTTLMRRDHGTDYGFQPGLNYRRGGLDVHAEAFYYNVGSYSYQTGSFERRNFVRQAYNTNNHTDGHMENAKLQLNYEISPLHSLGVSYTIAGSTTNLFGKIDYDQQFYDNRAQQELLDIKGKIKKLPSHTINAYYAGKVQKADIRLDVDYNYGHTHFDQYTNVSYNSAFDHVVTNINPESHRLWAAKLVLSYPLWKGSISAGYEGTDTHRQTLFESTGAVENHTDDDIRENTHAAFAEYNLSIAPFSASMGLRYEATKAEYRQFGILDHNLSRNYTGFYPSASVGYSKGQTSLLLSFSKKTTRPAYRLLSSNRQYDNDYMYEGGNPYLQPTLIYTYALDARYKWVTLSGSFFHYDGCIVSMDEEYGTDGATLLKPYNISGCKSVVAALGIAPTIGIWSPRYSISMLGTWRDYRQFGLSGHFFRPLWTFKLNNSLRLPWQLLLGVNYTYNAAGYNDNRWIKPSSRLDLSLQRSFLGQRLSVGIQALDIFHTDSDGSTANYRYISTDINRATDTRYIRLDLRYSFNMARSKYKGTGAGNVEKGRL